MLRKSTPRSFWRAGALLEQSPFDRLEEGILRARLDLA